MSLNNTGVEAVVFLPSALYCIPRSFLDRLKKIEESQQANAIEFRTVDSRELLHLLQQLRDCLNGIDVVKRHSEKPSVWGSSSADQHERTNNADENENLVSEFRVIPDRKVVPHSEAKASDGARSDHGESKGSNTHDSLVNRPTAYSDSNPTDKEKGSGAQVYSLREGAILQDLLPLLLRIGDGQPVVDVVFEILGLISEHSDPQIKHAARPHIPLHLVLTKIGDPEGAIRIGAMQLWMKLVKSKLVDHEYASKVLFQAMEIILLSLSKDEKYHDAEDGFSVVNIYAENVILLLIFNVLNTSEASMSSAHSTCDDAHGGVVSSMVNHDNDTTLRKLWAWFGELRHFRTILLIGEAIAVANRVSKNDYHRRISERIVQQFIEEDFETSNEGSANEGTEMEEKDNVAVKKHRSFLRAVVENQISENRFDPLPCLSSGGDAVLVPDAISRILELLDTNHVENETITASYKIIVRSIREGQLQRNPELKNVRGAALFEKDIEETESDDEGSEEENAATGTEKPLGEDDRAAFEVGKDDDDPHSWYRKPSLNALYTASPQRRASRARGGSTTRVQNKASKALINFLDKSTTENPARDPKIAERHARSLSRMKEERYRRDEEHAQRKRNSSSPNFAKNKSGETMAGRKARCKTSLNAEDIMLQRLHSKRRISEMKIEAQRKVAMDYLDGEKEYLEHLRNVSRKLDMDIIVKKRHRAPVLSGDDALDEILLGEFLGNSSVKAKDLYEKVRTLKEETIIDDFLQGDCGGPPEKKDASSQSPPLRKPSGSLMNDGGSPSQKYPGGDKSPTQKSPSHNRSPTYSRMSGSRVSPVDHSSGPFRGILPKKQSSVLAKKENMFRRKPPRELRNNGNGKRNGTLVAADKRVKKKTETPEFQYVEDLVSVDEVGLPSPNAVSPANGKDDSLEEIESPPSKSERRSSLFRPEPIDSITEEQEENVGEGGYGYGDDDPDSEAYHTPYDHDAEIEWKETNEEELPHDSKFEPHYEDKSCHEGKPSRKNSGQHRESKEDSARFDKLRLPKNEKRVQSASKLEEKGSKSPSKERHSQTKQLSPLKEDTNSQGSKKSKKTRSNYGFYNDLYSSGSSTFFPTSDENASTMRDNLEGTLPESEELQHENETPPVIEAPFKIRLPFLHNTTSPLIQNSPMLLQNSLMQSPTVQNSPMLQMQNPSYVNGVPPICQDVSGSPSVNSLSDLNSLHPQYFSPHLGPHSGIQMQQSPQAIYPPGNQVMQNGYPRQPMNNGFLPQPAPPQHFKNNGLVPGNAIIDSVMHSQQQQPFMQQQQTGYSNQPPMGMQNSQPRIYNVSHQPGYSSGGGMPMYSSLLQSGHDLMKSVIPEEEEPHIAFPVKLPTIEEVNPFVLSTRMQDMYEVERRVEYQETEELGPFLMDPSRNHCNLDPDKINDWLYCQVVKLLKSLKDERTSWLVHFDALDDLRRAVKYFPEMIVKYSQSAFSREPSPHRLSSSPTSKYITPVPIDLSPTQILKGHGGILKGRTTETTDNLFNDMLIALLLLCDSSRSTVSRNALMALADILSHPILVGGIQNVHGPNKGVSKTGLASIGDFARGLHMFLRKSADSNTAVVELCAKGLDRCITVAHEGKLLGALAHVIWHKLFVSENPTTGARAHSFKVVVPLTMRTNLLRVTIAFLERNSVREWLDINLRDMEDPSFGVNASNNVAQPTFSSPERSALNLKTGHIANLLKLVVASLEDPSESVRYLAREAAVELQFFGGAKQWERLLGSDAVERHTFKRIFKGR